MKQMIRHNSHSHTHAQVGNTFVHFAEVQKDLYGEKNKLDTTRK